MASLRPRSDRDGDEETLPDGTVVTHRFASIDGVRAHFVTAGGPTSRTVVVLHGVPETWWAWHSQIGALAAAHHVVAVDMCGYGQSDTRTDIDCSPAGGAARLLGLLDHLHVDRFQVIAHDRGAVLADHLCGVPGANSRMVSYVRMQQSGSEPHSEPRPPHTLFADPVQGPKLFSDERFIDLAFRDRLVAIPIAETIVERLRAEWYRPGVADAVSAYFRTTNFDIELEQRHDSLFSAMTMPVLFLQGSLDPGQQPHEYERVTDWVTDGELRFVEAGHFLHLESPEEVNEILTDWLARHR